MSRYYDEKCQQCEQCHFFGYGSFPDGTGYEACRSAGYILHLDKGISSEPCPRFRTEQQYKEEQKLKELQKRHRR